MPFKKNKHFYELVNQNASLITLWLIFTGVLLYNAQNADWHKSHRLKDDVQLYYIYASAVIVHGECDLEKVHQQLPPDGKNSMVA